MPDDQIIEEVAEPADDPLIEDAESNEADAFASDTDEGDETATGLEQVPAEKKEIEETPEKPEEGKEAEPGEEETAPEGGEVDDEDDDIKRGKEILAVQEAQRAEQEKALQEAEQRRQQEEYDSAPRNLSSESFSGRDIKEIFAPVIPKNLFPKEPVELEDGTKLDFQQVIGDYPELPIMITMVANNMVRRMMQNGVLMNTQQYESDKQNFAKNVGNQTFARTVMHPVYGVPEAKAIVTGENFKQWFEKQPDAIKALRTSGDPWDYIKMVKRFQNKEVLGKAKEEAHDIDDKRRRKKEVADGVLKAGKKQGSRQKPSNTPAGLGSPEDEAEAFESDDKDDFF